jgi:protein-tyrosine phosphatase
VVHPLHLSLLIHCQASILRQIVAGPRVRHPKAGLNLCYVTDFIVVTSGPSFVWPKKAYQNPTDQLVKFLDYKHGEKWAIFEFRAEGTGYPDSHVYGIGYTAMKNLTKHQQIN